MITFQSVSKSFGNQIVLDSVSVEIKNGERICIAGKSGAGKSVLLKLAIGLLKPDSGKVMLDGKDSSLFSETEWHQILNEFGYVFQGSALFDSMTVMENVGLKLDEEGKQSKTEIRSRVVEALGKVGLDESILPKFPSELSGGMKKRVAIARAIIHQPKYLFYDEPTTGLDPASAATIHGLINEISETPGVTTIVVSHDPECIRTTSRRVVLLNAGKIAFDGTVTNFFVRQEEAVKEFLGK